MTERLFSSIKKLNSCKDFSGRELCAEVQEKGEQDSVETRASHPIVTFPVCVKRLKASVYKVVPG